MEYDRRAVEERRKEKLPYDYYKSIFKDHDPMKMQENTGCKYRSETNEFIVRMLDREYIVKHPDGEVYNWDYSELSSYPIKTLLLRYLINSRAAAPLNRDVAYRDLPGGNVYYRNFNGRCIMRLARTFGNNLEGFERACKLIGGKRAALGDVSYKLEFVNNVYITLALWRGDEEFPASAQILFDGNVSFYFDAEDLAFVGDICIERLKQLGSLKG